MAHYRLPVLLATRPPETADMLAQELSGLVAKEAQVGTTQSLHVAHVLWPFETSLPLERLEAARQD